MSESIHDKLKRVRKPRVHITYDVETNGSVVEKELPFVCGVMGDYSGDNTDKKAIKDRKFSQIDRDNFNEILGKIAPSLDLKVENTIAGDDTETPVSLNFSNMEDFEPHKIVDQVPALKSLLETRNKLRDLLTKADRSEELENILEDVLSSTEALQALSDELGVGEENKEGDE